jgi:hypothetical protein
MRGMVRMPDELELADWRRRVAELYADVRRLATSDPAAAHDLWRTVREGLFREHPQSPIPAGSRSGFRARLFPYDPTQRFEVTVESVASNMTAGDGRLQPIGLPMSAGTPLAFRPIGSVRIPLSRGERRLGLFWMEGYAGGLFLPFRDATNGRETYGAGRYLLDAAKGADLGGDAARGTLVLDFNFAYQPSCAFDPRWSCPLAPPANRLDIAIRAGERIA